MNDHRPLYGIIGGMGPVASAEFLKNIYAHCSGAFETERDYPRIILVSDPLAPERSGLLTNEKLLQFTDYMQSCVQDLLRFKVDKILICCLLAHFCLKEVLPQYKAKIINIIDLLRDSIDSAKLKVLLLTTSQFYNLKLVNSPNIIQPEASDILKIEQAIFSLKTNFSLITVKSILDLIQQMVIRYEVAIVAFACSELSLIKYYVENNKVFLPFQIIDAIEIAAKYVLNDR